MAASPQRIPKRTVIYARDVENITGRKERAARRVLQKIRVAFGKPRDGFVTVKEFTIYTGIDEDIVKEYLID